MSSNITKEAPEHKGKIHNYSHTPKKIGQPKKHSHLPKRMKADDSEAVLMSDRKLGAGIRDRGY